jgi:hypothetical protein
MPSRLAVVYTEANMANSTTFMTRDQLEADAVVPQCLDNQFVSERVFRHMIDSDADYSDKTVHDLRETETKSELIRSLVYASQVIINRAYMRNNENIFKY